MIAGDTAGPESAGPGSAASDRLPLRLRVNGREQRLEVEARRLLVDVLREDLDLTGTKVACDTSQCGACTVHLDGLAVKSCTVLALQADGGDVLTIEGVAAGLPRRANLEPALHPMQAAFVEEHGFQCGFCTPGMIMAALGLVARSPDPSDDEIREALHGNFCRCTGYQTIVDSIRAGAAAMRAGSSELKPFGASDRGSGDRAAAGTS